MREAASAFRWRTAGLYRMRLRASFTVAFRGDQCGDSSIPSDRRQLLEFLNQLAYGERAGGGKNTWSRGADELDKKRLEWRKHWLPSPGCLALASPENATGKPLESSNVCILASLTLALAWDWR